MQSINTKRRDFLGAIIAATASALLLPLRAVAALWNKAAFDAIKLDDAAKNLAINAEIPSKDIEIIAPDRAENGAIVQIEITSRIPNTEAIAVFVEKNPTALIGNFMFSQYQENNLGALPQIVTRIKMAETSDIKIIVKAGNQYYSNAKNVIVLESGCD
jgi:sulfur-oxidizing protein SoxY